MKIHSVILPRSIGIVVVGVLAVVVLAGIMLRYSLLRNNRLNVILILTDTLRADHLGIYGYKKNTSPRIDDFAKKSILFENAIAQGPWTKPSLGSLFTSLYPHSHGAMSNIWQTLAEEVVTLPEVLRENGYHTVGFQTNPLLTQIFNFNQGFKEYQELIVNNFKEGLVMLPAKNVVDAFMDWAEKKRKEPFFAYLHFMDCHLPYRPPDEDRALFVGPYEGRFLPNQIRSEHSFRIQDNASQLTEADKKHIIELYDASIHYLDAQIGRLLDGLSHRKLLERTIIILVADHGEELFDHGGFGHGQTLYNELLHVPFILWHPGLAKHGIRVQQQVRLIDIFPSVLSFLDIKPQTGLFGKDISPLLSNPENDERRVAFSEGVGYVVTPPGRTGENFVSLQEGGNKFIRQTIFGQKVVENYDLAKDPGELLSLDIGDALLQAKENLLDEYRAEGKHRKNPDAGRQDKEFLDRLRSLGYLH